MKILLTSILVVLAATLVASPASATVIFSDDFNSDTVGDLNGQAADTLQTWVAGGAPTPQVGTAYGPGGSQGAGSSGGGSYGSYGTTASLGTTLTAGDIRLEADLTISGDLTTYRDSYLQIFDTVNGTNGSLSWTVRSDGASYVALEGALSPYPSDYSHNPGLTSGTVHVTLDVDLDTKTVNLSWYDVANPTNNDSFLVGTYAVDFAPDKVGIAFEGAGGTGSSGVDNIVLQTIVPEPSTLVLLASGLLGLLCYAWRKRR